MKYVRDRGYVLITSLLLLVIITILGVGAVSTVTLEERMASNMQEKQRALEATSIALRKGENDLFKLTEYPVTTPGGTVNINSPGIDAGVASNPTYSIAQVKMSPLGGELTPASQMGNRSQAQAYYYSVVAAGTGGNTSANSLLQSIYGRIY
jgi:type IV pilus assembly protein PilX